MSNKEIAKVLEELAANEQAKAILKEYEKPDATDEDRIKAYVEVAEKCGYSLTADDLRAYAEEMANDVKASTDKAADAVKEVSDDEMEAVAGGYYLQKCNWANLQCKDTYEDKENCWVTDGCDYVFEIYPYYSCKKTPN